MSADGSSPREVLETLLRPRGLSAPDGRPLYRYRFTRAEYDALGRFLRQKSLAELRTAAGAALVVAHSAEWFRRDRAGGHWDWKRPLGSIGVRYGDGWRSTVQYSDVVEIVSRGFAAWRRPAPASSDRLFSVVREAGFPSASVRENPRIATWLRKSVLAAERGFSARDAVRSEAWRVADAIAATLFGAAEELCEAVVELRRHLPEPALRGEDDPIAHLDRLRPGWRDRLPFDVELEDLREMVETIVRARAERTEGLAVTRRLVRGRGGFASTAEIALDGDLHPRRLPREVAAEIASLVRMRIVPKPPLGDGFPIAAVERIADEEGEESWEVRRFVARFEVACPLETDVRVMLVTGERIVSEFVAFAGEPLTDPVVALEIEDGSEHEVVRSLRVLGGSPVRTPKPRLALAIEEEAFGSVSFSDGFEELGRCGTRRILSFSGTATLVAEGARTSWRTGAEREELGRLVLVGDLLRAVREPVFRGMPQVLSERDGGMSAVPPRRLRCRAIGGEGGPWRPLDGSSFGRIHLAVMEGDEILQQSRAAVVPSDFGMTANAAARTLSVRGLAGAAIGAAAPAPLPARPLGDRAQIDLATMPPGGTLRLSLRWRSELTLTMTDPLLDRALLDPNGRSLPPRAELSVNALHGYRLVSAAGERVCLELSARDARTIHLVRRIEGEVPLSALAEDALRLIGGSELLDSEVRLSWLGSSDRMAVVRWYAEEVDPFLPPARNAFGALSQMLGYELAAFSLVEPRAGVATRLSREAPAEMAARLTAELGAGPWLVWGKRSEGGLVRPRVLSPVIASAADDETPLEATIAEQNGAARERRLDDLYARPAALGAPDRRRLIDLVVRCRDQALPCCSVDPLRHVAHRPELAVFLLWSCETSEERSAVLDLQRELPFLWCATPIAVWQEAAEERLLGLRERLSGEDLPPELADVSFERAVEEMLTFRPELVVHLRAVHLAQLSGGADRGSAHGLAARLGRAVSQLAADRERLFNDFIDRHSSCIMPPRDLLPEELLETVAAAWRSFHPAFAPVLAAPHLVAEHAAGRTTLPLDVLRRCREAWVFDPFHFERTVPFALDAIGRGRTH
jgi:hypothetical protein